VDAGCKIRRADFFMTVYLLPEEPFFPPLGEAEPDGLVAIGGDLSVERLVQAYSQGIFPWFLEEDGFFWYSPDPRMVLFPDKHRIPVSFRRILKKNPFEVRFDTNFDQVIRACSRASRPGQDGTWISEEFINGYTELYRHGLAHSVETYSGGTLVGGLYGVSLGRAFFGESMFYTVSHASKAAFHALVGFAMGHNFRFIDCQVYTSHLKSLGAEMIPRENYLALLDEAIRQPTLKGPWR